MLVAEALSGIVTGFLVSPTNVVVDKSVMQYANKAESSIWVAAAKTFKSLFVSPLKFVMAFEFRWQCYFNGLHGHFTKPLQQVVSSGFQTRFK